MSGVSLGASLDSLTHEMFLPLLVAYIIFGLDDVIVDFLAWYWKLLPAQIPWISPSGLRVYRRKRLAVVIAAWHEGDVIARMIRGNLARVDYDNYDFFVGCYANDEETCQALADLSDEFPRVHRVINSRPGPTSKGQMLNELVSAIYKSERTSGQRFEGLVIHDAEDLLHPASLLTINDALDDADFVQIPVLSLPLPGKEWIGAIYMDEFAEWHGKDLRVRNRLSGGFPAAGVGMALSRPLLDILWEARQKCLFNESSLTEDYELGLDVRRLGARCLFVVARSGAERDDVIATREFFPKKLRGSVRQKTRWTIGIAFQGLRRLGWSGTVAQKFFLYRDRKGPLAYMTVTAGFFMITYLALRLASGVPRANLVPESAMCATLLILTQVIMFNRVFQRMRATYAFYGWQAAALAPLRILLGNFVNALAAANATLQFSKSLFKGRQVQWAKTTHELPAGFGLQSILVFPILFPFLVAAVLAAPAPSIAAAEPRTDSCVRVYYDAGPETYNLGELYSVFLRNLLGHFPNLQQIVAPIESYKGGDIERCRSTIYIGSYFENRIPTDFLHDFSVTKRNVAWLGYSVWKLGREGLAQTFGVEYLRLTTLDLEHRDAKGRPTFFSTIRYKGEQFRKYGEFKRDDPKTFLAPFEMTALDVIDPETTVLAEAIHDGSGSGSDRGVGERLPYALRRANHFYVADVPFSFMHESDRYLVFADLLFDILKEKPRHTGPRPAVFRLEDIHARVPQYQIYDIARTVAANRVPLHIAMIPIFFDPLQRADRGANDELVFMHQDPLFLNLLDELKKQNARFIWHGVTHQYKRIPNPHNAVSGDDFEFWDANNNRPVEDDSLDFVLKRLNDGWYSLDRAAVHPRIWEVPHYQASVLDYLFFARLFSWNIGRVIYSLYSAKGLPESVSPDLWFQNGGIAADQKRRAALGNVSVNVRSSPSGQFFPYEIYGDVYGQRVLPENLGNIQPMVNDHVVTPRSVDKILEAARRNLKLRDVWGSLFFHPQLVDPTSRDGIGDFPGDTKELNRLLREMKDMGYEFIDLDSFIDTPALRSLRTPPAKIIERTSP